MFKVLAGVGPMACRSDAVEAVVGEGVAGMRGDCWECLGVA